MPTTTLGRELAFRDFCSSMAVPPRLAQLSARIVVLDGGLSTTLEDAGADLSSALWSSQLLSTADGRERISTAHRAFVDAGCDVIQTATYQSSEAGFARASSAPPRPTMCSAVSLAREAAGPSKLVALSLGSYGATMQPSTEYSGLFDGPYALSKPSSVEALTRWHAERLEAFTAAWDEIDVVMFETVPLLTEIRAIRLAIQRVDPRKPFSITVVAPDGAIPHARHPDRDPHARYDADAIAAAALLDDALPRPFAIGANCTKMRFLETLGPALARATAALQPTWLILAPDGGGLVYDTVSRTWNEDATADGSQSVDGWAQRVATVATACAQHVDGVIVGGCCKSTPAHIAAMSACIGGRRS